GNTSGPYQHFYMGVFRAVENHRYLIRVANSGISGFIGPDGRVIKKTNLFERTTLTEMVNTINKKSFYTRWGDVFSIICVFYTVILLAFSVTRRSKR
ncbi:MAG: apolipoprotein N-acyltransferase, partial [Nitrospirae bacterium]